jgi:hypothetical protein
MRLNDDRACAETCLAAHAFFSAKADAAEVKADEARKRAVVTGKVCHVGLVTKQSYSHQIWSK